MYLYIYINTYNVFRYIYIYTILRKIFDVRLGSEYASEVPHLSK